MVEYTYTVQDIRSSFPCFAFAVFVIASLTPLDF